MKHILVVSHCILNTAAKVKQDERELEEEYRLKKQLMDAVLDKNIQLLQLPCPEFLMYGSRRWGHVKNQFLHPHFRAECEKMLEPILMQLEEYLTYPEEFRVLGIVSVEGSPSCGYQLTCRGDWCGEFGNAEEVERMRGTLEMVRESGVLMQILGTKLSERKMDVTIFSMKDAIEVLTSL